MEPSFRTIRVSDPRYEQDGLKFVTVKSKHLGRRGDVCLFIPQGVEELSKLNVYILLHGVYGSAWSWALAGGAHKTAQRLIESKSINPCILAMPSDGLWGDGSGYIDHENNSFEKWIVEDVPEIIKHLYPNQESNTTYSIGGLSMGGFGALHLGSKYPTKFSAISAHSAITKLEEMQPFVEEDFSLLQNSINRTNPIDYLIANSEILPPLRFDCGVDDDLIGANRLLHQKLTESGIDHIYEEFPGGHEWSYWEMHIEKTLLFFDSNLKS